MIPIKIDADDIMDQLGLTEAEARNMIDYTVKEVTATFATEWEATAARELGQSREEYVKNLQVVDDGWARGSVVLFGWLPNAIEDGYPAFDMKSGLLQGENAKLSQDGTWFNTVPYRWAVPSSVGESPVFTGKMPEEIHEIVKAKPAIKPIAGGGMASEGLTNKELPIGHNQPQVKAVPSIAPKPAGWQAYYQHKAPVFQGLRKVVDPVTKQNRYQTFRRVSENSEPEAWIHPGFQPRGLAEVSLGNMNMELTIGNAIDAYLAKIGYEA